MKTFMIDIDGTITDDIPNEEPDRMVTCQPFKGAVEAINKLYDLGHTIVFFTARPIGLLPITREWLDKHGFKYHNILTGKPRGGNWVWIDNLPGEFRQYKGGLHDILPELFIGEDEARLI